MAFANADSFLPWNGFPWERADPAAPWNLRRWRNDPAAPWNRVGADELDLERYCRERSIACAYWVLHLAPLREERARAVRRPRNVT